MSKGHVFPISLVPQAQSFSCVPDTILFLCPRHNPSLVCPRHTTTSSLCASALSFLLRSLCSLLYFAPFSRFYIRSFQSLFTPLLTVAHSHQTPPLFPLLTSRSFTLSHLSSLPLLYSRSPHLTLLPSRSTHHRPTPFSRSFSPNSISIPAPLQSLALTSLHSNSHSFQSFVSSPLSRPLLPSRSSLHSVPVIVRSALSLVTACPPHSMGPHCLRSKV